MVFLLHGEDPFRIRLRTDELVRSLLAGGHGERGDLASRERLDSPIHFAAEMWNHAPRMHEFVTDAGIAWPSFDAEEVSDLVAYLRQRRAGAMN